MGDAMTKARTFTTLCSTLTLPASLQLGGFAEGSATGIEVPSGDFVTIDDQLAYIATQFPGFGGAYIDGTQVVIWTTSPSLENSGIAIRDALTQIDPYYAGRTRCSGKPRMTSAH